MVLEIAIKHIDPESRPGSFSAGAAPNLERQHYGSFLAPHGTQGDAKTAKTPKGAVAAQQLNRMASPRSRRAALMERPAAPSSAKGTASSPPAQPVLNAAVAQQLAIRPQPLPQPPQQFKVNKAQKEVPEPPQVLEAPPAVEEEPEQAPLSEAFRNSDCPEIVLFGNQTVRPSSATREQLGDLNAQYLKNEETLAIAESALTKNALIQWLLSKEQDWEHIAVLLEALMGGDPNEGRLVKWQLMQMWQDFTAATPGARVTMNEDDFIIALAEIDEMGGLRAASISLEAYDQPLSSSPDSTPVVSDAEDGMEEITGAAAAAQPQPRTQPQRRRGPSLAPASRGREDGDSASDAGSSGRLMRLDDSGDNNNNNNDTASQDSRPTTPRVMKFRYPGAKAQDGGSGGGRGRISAADMRAKLAAARHAIAAASLFATNAGHETLAAPAIQSFSSMQRLMSNMSMRKSDMGTGAGGAGAASGSSSSGSNALTGVHGQGLGPIGSLGSVSSNGRASRLGINQSVLSQLGLESYDARAARLSSPGQLGLGPNNATASSRALAHTQSTLAVEGAGRASAFGKFLSGRLSPGGIDPGELLDRERAIVLEALAELDASPTGNEGVRHLHQHHDSLADSDDAMLLEKFKAQLQLQAAAVSTVPASPPRLSPSNTGPASGQGSVNNRPMSRDPNQIWGTSSLPGRPGRYSLDGRMLGVPGAGAGAGAAASSASPAASRIGTPSGLLGLTGGVGAASRRSDQQPESSSSRPSPGASPSAAAAAAGGPSSGGLLQGLVTDEWPPQDRKLSQREAEELALESEAEQWKQRMESPIPIGPPRTPAGAAFSFGDAALAMQGSMRARTSFKRQSSSGGVALGVGPGGGVSDSGEGGLGISTRALQPSLSRAAQRAYGHSNSTAGRLDSLSLWPSLGLASSAAAQAAGAAGSSAPGSPSLSKRPSTVHGRVSMSGGDGISGPNSGGGPQQQAQVLFVSHRPSTSGQQVGGYLDGGGDGGNNDLVNVMRDMFSDGTTAPRPNTTAGIFNRQYQPQRRHSTPGGSSNGSENSSAPGSPALAPSRGPLAVVGSTQRTSMSGVAGSAAGVSVDDFLARVTASPPMSPLTGSPGASPARSRPGQGGAQAGANKPSRMRGPAAPPPSTSLLMQQHTQQQANRSPMKLPELRPGSGLPPIALPGSSNPNSPGLAVRRTSQTGGGGPQQSPHSPHIYVRQGSVSLVSPDMAPEFEHHYEVNSMPARVPSFGPRGMQVVQLGTGGGSGQ